MGEAGTRPQTKSGFKEEENTMRVKAHVKAGKLAANHSQAVKGLRVKSAVRAGKIAFNHSQTLAR
jgi:hypothetical protein